MKNIFSAFMVTLILVGTLMVAFDAQPVKASGTVYIRADGSIDPPTANITTADNVTYTFIENNYDSIDVQRNNIIIDGMGFTVQGTGSGTGMMLSERSNVTIRNTQIRAFAYGISLTSSVHNNVSGNNIMTDSGRGIWLLSSSNNSILRNNIANSDHGIVLFHLSNDNSISGNNITANNSDGIFIFESSNNSIWGNNITSNYHGIVSTDPPSSYNSIFKNNIADNYYGIWFYSSSNNRVFHNNLINNTYQLYSSSSANIWDNDYPSGGNYWSNYADTDVYKGPHQNETGSDGAWDHPRVIDDQNQDRFPLTRPFGGSTGDVDGDNDVDIFDIVRMAGVYGANYPDSRYDRLCDMDLDGDIDIFDLVIAAGHYGQS